MKPITSPINREEPRENRAAEVTNLQDGLLLLLRKGFIRLNEREQRSFEERILAEQREKLYGDGTEKLVSILQEQNLENFRLELSGKVDEATATALNTLIRQLDPVSGLERAEISLGMSGSRVGEVQRGLTRLGYDIPSKEATQPVFGPGTQTAIRRFQDAMSLTLSGRADERTLEALEQALAEQGGTLWRVEGRLFHEHGGPAVGVNLRLHQSLFGGKTQRLTEQEIETDELGYYAATYSPATATVLLTVMARISDQEEVALSQPVKARRREVLNLVLPAKFQLPTPSEFSRLNEAVSAHLGGRRIGDALENGERNDLSLLHQITGWDARILALAAQADRLAMDPGVVAAGLGGEALYGLVRAGLPTSADRLALESEVTVEEALNKATVAAIVQLGGEAIAREKRAFRAFADQIRLTLRAPGTRFTTGEMLKSVGLGETEQTGFTRAYARHLRSGVDLWIEARNEGVPDDQISKLRVQGKLAYLTQNHLPVVEKLVATVNSLAPDDISGLIDHDYHEAAAWEALYAEVAGGSSEENLESVRPPAYKTATAAGAVAAASADHARHLRIAYPTHVARRVLENDTTNRMGLRLAGQQTQVHQVLRRAQSLPGGFELGRQSVDAFVNRNRAALFPGATDAEISKTTQALRTVQRVFQVSPSADSMAKLMSLGFKSAQDITRFSKVDFLRAYAHHFATPEEPALVYDKAQQVSVVAFNFFSMAQQALNGQATGATHLTKSDTDGMESAEDTQERKSVLENLKSQFPTLETLLGEQDYAECQGCQSVLSPSAYFVDLLEFLNPDDLVWGNFLANWKHTHLDEPYPHPKPFEVLMQHRPDLEHLPLTCENTETVLPYIDVVNEILEYSVARGPLKADAVHDTAGARSDELIAEPQNLLPEAYEKLKGARYPLTLPFDLWLETVRRYFKHQDTTLAEAMAALCPTEKLHEDTVPALRYDLADVAIEGLGFSRDEARLLTDPTILSEWWKLYGYDSEPEAGEAVIQLDGNPVPNAKLLSRRLGVTYKELTTLVQTEFLNPALKPAAFLHRLGMDFSDLRRLKTPLADPQDEDERQKAILELQKRIEIVATELFKAEADAMAERGKSSTEIAQALAQAVAAAKTGATAAETSLDLTKILVLRDSDNSARFDQTTLQFANAIGTPVTPLVLLKLNLVVRLWRKLGWSLADTDHALCLFCGEPATINDIPTLGAAMRTALPYLARTKHLLATLPLGARGLPKLLTFWTDLPSRGKDSLYARLFLNRAVLRNAPAFDHPLGAYLSNPNVALKDHLTAVQGALGLSADDIALLAAQAAAPLQADRLTIPIVSWLYRHAILAKAAKLSVAELITLKDISGLDPFAPLATRDAVSDLDDDVIWSQTLPFIEIAAMLRERGVKVTELDGLLRHRHAADSKEQPRPEVALALTQALAAGQRQIAAEHAPPDSVDAAWLLPRLGLLLPADLAAEIVELCFGTGEFEVSTEDNVVEPASQIPAATFSDEPALKLGYSSVRKRQRLAWRGYLTKAKAVALKATPMSASNTALAATLIDKLRLQQGPAIAAILRRVLSVLRARTDILLSPEMATNIATAALDAMLVEVEFHARRQSGPLSVDVAKAIETLDGHPQVRIQHDAPTQTLHVSCIGVLSNAARQILLTTTPAAVRALLDEVHAQATDAIKELRDHLGDLFANNPPRVFADNARVSLANAWRPLVVARASRLFIEATLANELPGNSTLTNLLLNDATNLHLATVPSRTLCDIFMEPGTPPDPITFDGYFQIPTNGAYRLTVDGLAKVEAGSIVIDGETTYDKNVGDDNPTKSKAVELRAGAFVRCQVVGLNPTVPSKLRVLIQGETLPLGNLDRLPMYSKAASDRVGRALLLLAKALRFVQASGIGESELRFALEKPTDFAGLSLSALPLEADAAAETAAPGLLRQWQSLVRLGKLKSILGIEADGLLSILRARSLAEAEPRITPVLGGNAAKFGEVAAHLQVSAPLNVASLTRLWSALGMVARLGGADVSVLDGSVADVLKWVGPAPTQDTARDVRNAVKARVALEDWPGVAQPIHDPLRQLQRDALVAFLLHREKLERVEQLNELFLLDPANEPVVQTSRMALAISCVQLFIHRAFLNMVPKVHPSTLDPGLWACMKSIALWGAGRRIYCHPENYLQPEFRDDKSHLFQELEGKLLQGNVTSDLAEEAFHGYLQGLQEIAKMQLVTMYCEQFPDPSKNVIHLIGRTPNSAAKYFYRRCVDSMWTPWEPVSVSMEGDHIAAIVWRGRLQLFWLMFLPAGDQSQASKDCTVEGAAKKKSGELVVQQRKVQLNWSEYYQGKWSARKFGQGDTATLDFKKVPPEFKNSQLFVHASKESDGNGGDGTLWIGVHDTYGLNLGYGFKLHSKLVSPVAVTSGAPTLPPLPYVGSLGNHPTKLTGSSSFWVRLRDTIVTKGGIETPGEPSPHRLIGSPTAFELLTCPHPAPLPTAEIAALTSPFFYEDAETVLFVEPTFVEKTVDEWQSYGVPLFPSSKFPDKARALQPELSAHYKEQLVIPNRVLDPVGPVAKQAVTPLKDWVTQADASIHFNGETVRSIGGVASTFAALNR